MYFLQQSAQPSLNFHYCRMIRCLCVWQFLCIFVVCLSKENQSQLNDVLLISSLEGSLAAVQEHDGKLVWKYDFGQGLFSSSLSSLEVIKDGAPLRLVPSLDGRMFAVYEDNVQLLQFDVNSFLDNSFRLSNDIFIAGSKSVVTYGFGLHTGLKKYHCNESGCWKMENSNNENATTGDSSDERAKTDRLVVDDDEPMLVVKLVRYVIRAIHVLTGEERWNFSVAYPEVQLVRSEHAQGADGDGRVGAWGKSAVAKRRAGKATKSTLPFVHARSARGAETDAEFRLSFVRSRGLVKRTRADGAAALCPHPAGVWQYAARAPLVAVWRVAAAALADLPLGTRLQPLAIHDDSGRDDGPLRQQPILYVNSYRGQLYIQVPESFGSSALTTVFSWPSQAQWRSVAAADLARQVATHDTTTTATTVPQSLMAIAAQLQRHLDLIGFGEVAAETAHLPDAAAGDSDAAIVSSERALVLFPDVCPQLPDLPKRARSKWQQVRSWLWAVATSSVTTSAAGFFIALVLLRALQMYLWPLVPGSLLRIELRVVLQQPFLRRRVRRDTATSAAGTSSTPAPSADQLPPPPPLPSQPLLREESKATTANSDSNGSCAFRSRYIEEFMDKRLLGSGGFGKVFQAKNRYDDCSYAIKLIPVRDTRRTKQRHVSGERDCVDRMLREAKTLATLDHQHIIRYYSCWIENWPTDRVPAANADSHDRLLSTAPLSTSHPGDVAFSLQSTSHVQPSCRSDDASNDRVIFQNSASHAANGNAPNNPLPKSAATDFNSHDFEYLQHHAAGVTNSAWTSLESEELARGGGDEQAAKEDEQQQAAGSGSDEASEEAAEEQPPGNVQYLFIQMELCYEATLCTWLAQTAAERSRSLRVSSVASRLTFDDVDSSPRAATDLPPIERNRASELRIFHQIVQAVSYIHATGLMHRDLKPSNILFSMQDGKVKVSDFGLAVWQTRGDLTQRAGAPPAASDVQTNDVGTSLYMSPEQVSRKPYDNKVDVFSLGLILFELLYAMATRMERDTTLPRVKALQFPDNFSQADTQYISKLLSPVPDQRPSADDILKSDLWEPSC